jgi:hypothetical protein
MARCDGSISVNSEPDGGSSSGRMVKRSPVQTGRHHDEWKHRHEGPDLTQQDHLPYQET